MSLVALATLALTLFQAPNSTMMAARIAKFGAVDVVKVEDAVANTRKGKQVLNVKAPDKAAAIAPAGGDHVAVIGENRKMLVFPAKDLPEMGRGAGVKLQRYKDGGLSDAKTFNLDEGLGWTDSAQRQHALSKGELRDWRGSRADAGRLAPKGFPKNNRVRG